ncbi:hypothetical protein ABER74_24480, partial [Peribacillus frigoritolerans]
MIWMGQKERAESGIKINLNRRVKLLYDFKNISLWMFPPSFREVLAGSHPIDRTESGLESLNRFLFQVRIELKNGMLLFQIQGSLLVTKNKQPREKSNWLFIFYLAPFVKIVVFKRNYLRLIGAEVRDSCGSSGTGETPQAFTPRRLTARPAESEHLEG